MAWLAGECGWQHQFSALQLTHLKRLHSGNRKGITCLPYTPDTPVPCGYYVQAEEGQQTPQKAHGFLQLSGLASCQDGDDRAHGFLLLLSSQPSKQSLSQRELPWSPEPNGESSPPNSPITASPSKSKLRTEEPEHSQANAASCQFSRSLLLNTYPCWVPSQPQTNHSMKAQ